MSHLVDEGGKLVVEGLDLLPLLSPDPLDGGVDLHVQRGEEVLVDGDLLDASRWAHREASSPIATTKASSISKVSRTPKPKPLPAPPLKMKPPLNWLP